MSDRDDDDVLPEGSVTEPVGTPAPRAARFGEGPEGKAARRERGVHESRAGFFTRTSQFFHDVRMEMRRVSWPSLNEVKNTTIITIVAVIFFAIYLFAVDWGIVLLGRLFAWLFGLIGIEG
ncbi:MAG: preprotein translocase subunit SecE [Pyrinomonadaceae bacterium]|nr:preprotein translocase subunit SecE [Pyrinomonadaceae bacterium]